MSKKTVSKKVSNIWNSCKLAMKRTHVHVVPMHSEEGGEGGKEETEDHSSSTADFSCILGSQSLKINHKTSPPYQEAHRTSQRCALNPVSIFIMAEEININL